MASSTLLLPARFNGPPGSANGGWTCGAVARQVDVPAGGTAVVTLRVPPPLDTTLAVERTEGGGVLVTHDGVLVAEGQPTTLAAPQDVPRVSLEEARRAGARFAGFDDHLFDTCFVCGPRRPTDDGLRIYPGHVGDVASVDGLVATTWTPAADLGATSGDGTVDPRAVWAALDCPGAWACDISPGRPSVLGRLAVDVLAPVRVGEELVVLGRHLGTEGRKMSAATYLLDGDGRLLAHGLATWIKLPPPEATSS